MISVACHRIIKVRTSCVNCQMQYMLVTICTWTGILVDSNLLYLQFYDPDAKVYLGTFCGSGEASVQSSSSKIAIRFQIYFNDGDRFALSWKGRFYLFLYLKDATNLHHSLHDAWHHLSLVCLVLNNS